MTKTTRKHDDEEKEQVIADEAAAEKAFQKTQGAEAAAEDDVKPEGAAEVAIEVPKTPREQLLVDFEEFVALKGRGEHVSPERILDLLSRAMTQLREPHEILDL